MLKHDKERIKKWFCRKKYDSYVKKVHYENKNCVVEPKIIPKKPIVGELKEKG